MRLVCPHCGCAREIDEDLLPPGAERFICPGCGETFACNESCVAGGVAVRRVPLAGFWLRAVAQMIDLAVLGALQLGCTLLFVLVAAGLPIPADLRGWLLVATGAWGVAASVALAYGAIFVANGGQTPGKMALRLQVIHCDGSAVGFGRALRRELVGKTLSLLSFGAGFLQAAFDERKQALHDRLAETYVIKM